MADLNPIPLPLQPAAAAEGGPAQWIDSSSESPLLAAASRDPNAYSAIYLSHYRAVAGLIYRRTGDQHLTEDLAGDVFLAAYQALPRFRAGSVPLRAWLLRIATNRVNRWARRRRGLVEVLARLARIRTVLEAGPSPHDYPAALAALLNLPPGLQAVVSLHHLEGLSLDVCAQVLECPVGTVKSRLSRARTLMKTTLLAKGETP